MSPLFTLETSGHNPRPTKGNRMRNRVSHKFSFYPERYDGHYSCVGCGRCVVSCPVSLDIRHMVKAAVEGCDLVFEDAPAAPVVETAPVAEAPAPVAEAPVEAPKAPETKTAPAKPASQKTSKGKSKKK
jgi:Fe-S oxidoreductase